MIAREIEDEGKEGGTEDDATVKKDEKMKEEQGEEEGWKDELCSGKKRRPGRQRMREKREQQKTMHSGEGRVDRGGTEGEIEGQRRVV